MSIWERYAAKVSKPPELVVTYFGATRDGYHTFDVRGRSSLIGLVQRRQDGKPDKYAAWRNGHMQPADTLGEAVDWIVKRAKESGVMS